MNYMKCTVSVYVVYSFLYGLAFVFISTEYELLEPTYPTKRNKKIKNNILINLPLEKYILECEVTCYDILIYIKKIKEVAMI